MCGISGHLSFKSMPDVISVAKMTNGILHRGPDEEGLWISSSSHCVLGHTRLSIIDLSPLGKQPMYDPQTGNCIVFNGEIYNFKELRNHCELKGESFLSKTDTEVILVLYKIYGASCLKYLRGMFSFAIWDEGKQHLFVARDRVGKKPFNYVYNEEIGFVFCSEINPLASYPGVSKDQNNQALELYLQLQYIPAPHTIYRSIHKLPPASYGICNKNGFKINNYWDYDYRNKINIKESKAVDLLEEKLAEAVRIRMIADVPIGALLSGGVDSSLIVALMSKLNNNPIHTFSVGFEDKSIDELAYAQQVADKYDTIHFSEIVRSNASDFLPQIIKHYGEPFADPSAIPSFYVCKVARKKIIVGLNGDGGDELMGGYSRYIFNSFQMLFSCFFGSFIPSSFAAKMGPKLVLKSNSAIKKTASYLLIECLRPELRSITKYQYFFNERVRSRLLNNRFNSSYLEDWYVDILKQSCGKASHPIDRMLYIDNKNYLAGDLLVKMDIASMHCGLETRSPLLDHHLIEFCSSLPAHLKSKNGQGKYLLKKVAERYFPKEFVYREKMGFSIPLADWLNGSLKDLLLYVLHNPILMSDFDKKEIQNQLQPFLKGKNYTVPRLWTLMMYGLWKQECFLSKSSV